MSMPLIETSQRIVHLRRLCCHRHLPRQIRAGLTMSSMAAAAAREALRNDLCPPSRGSCCCSCAGESEAPQSIDTYHGHGVDVQWVERRVQLAV